MVVDDGQHLVVGGVGQLGVDLVRVDEGEVVDLADLAHRLDLAQLEAEQLHERAVLAVGELVRIADRRLCDAEPNPDVRLRDRARDAVRIRVTAKRDEKVLAAGRRQRLSEGAGP